MTNNNRSRLIIAATFLAAFILATVPGPDWAIALRPDWVSLVLIYWCMALPQRVGMGTGWITGLLLDVLYGDLLGQQALAKTVLAFLALKLHLRIRVFPVWQQALTIIVLLSVHQLLIVWIKGAVDQVPSGYHYWVPIFTSAVFWPWVFGILRRIRRRAHVS